MPILAWVCWMARDSGNAVTIIDEMLLAWTQLRFDFLHDGRGSC